MLKYYFFLLFIGYALVLRSQVNCVEIDFENIPNTIEREGITVTDEYADNFGVRFNTTAGNFPILAEVGAPSTGFGSAWGDDTARPGEDIGRFFLTDDGALQGLIAQPLNITFDSVVSYAAGCIIDIDLTEIFTITARDINGQDLSTIVITTGDAIAGDGAVSCWEFSAEMCLRISSILIQGTRTQIGQFGFGYDNFRFCYAASEPDIQINNPPCNVPFGSVLFNLNDTFHLNTYQFNDISFTSDTLFQDLSDGNYQFTIEDDTGCTTIFPIVITTQSAELVSAAISPFNCTSTNQNISITPVLGLNPMYSLDGISYQSSDVFENIQPGEYLIYFQDDNGCLDTLPITVPPFLPITIIDSTILMTSCNESNGSISLTAIGGEGDLSFMLNDEPAQDVGSFQNLQPDMYTVTVTDQNDCTVVLPAEIASSPPLVIADVMSSSSDCELDNGFISISLINNTPVQTSINNLISNNLSFIDLASADYSIIITDTFNCVIDTLIHIDRIPCSLDVPNVFTPNGDGLNDIFTIYPHSNFRGIFGTLYIYNRWGDNVYIGRDYKPRSDGWDGIYRGELAPVGVYVYYIEATFENGDKKLFKGDLTLLR